MRTAIGSKYTYDVDVVDKTRWADIMALFRDQSIYQTWAYGEVLCGRKNLSHLVLRKDGEVVSAAQVRIAKVPLAGHIGYVRWGPMWRLKCSEQAANENLHFMLEALRHEYVERRGYLLRLSLREYKEEATVVEELLVSCGYRRCQAQTASRTLLLDLSLSADQLKSNMRRTWRQTLGYAERKGLDCVEGRDKRLMEEGLMLYKQMHARKRFAEFVNMEDLIAAQELLDESQKIETIMTVHEQKAVAVLAWSSLGDTGIPLLSATGNDGLRTNSAYLLYWKMLERLKEHGCLWCDLGGINPERNSGGYTFKSGLVGKGGRDVHYLDQYEVYRGRVMPILVHGFDSFRRKVRRGRLALEGIRQRRKR